jgi:prepilin-type N-terminal cleavage/methylation domain-containing protein
MASLRRPAGFTILELMVAVTLSALVLLAGRSMIEQVARGAETIGVDAAIADSARMRARYLRTIIRSIEPDTSVNFVAGSQEARFATWCTGEERVTEQCVVTLTVDSLVRITEPSRALVVSRDSVQGELRYLGDARSGGTWYRSWGPGNTLPLAIGIVFRTDTTVLRIGDRG